MRILCSLLAALLCLLAPAGDVTILESKGIAALKLSQAEPDAVVSAAIYFGQAADAYQAAGNTEKATEMNSFLYWCKKKMTLAQMDVFLKGGDAINAIRTHEDVVRLVARPDMPLDFPIGIYIDLDDRNPDLIAEEVAAKPVDACAAPGRRCRPVNRRSGSPLSPWSADWPAVRSARHRRSPTTTTPSSSNASGLAAHVKAANTKNNRRVFSATNANATPSMNGYAAETTSNAQTTANVRIVHRLCNSHSWRTTAEKATTATVTVRTASSLMPIAAASG